MSEHHEPGGDRDDLLVTVASLYYELNQNQQQIAERLEISRSSVSRMIKEARERGIVEIRIYRPIYRDYRLEQGLIEAFGLHDAYVLLTTAELHDDQMLYGVGRLAAGYIERAIAGLDAGACIGIAWGTGVHATLSALSEERNRQIDVVQVLGSVGAANSLIDGPDLARLGAARLGGRHFDLHAPVLVEQEGLRDLLAQEPSVRDGLQRARGVALALTGIGTLHEEAASFLRAGHLGPADLARLRAEGLVGETVGRFFDEQGRDQPYAINQRVIGIDLEDLRRIPRVVAVARGLPKAQSILGALRGRCCTVLATDDLTARAVLELQGWRADSRLAQAV